MPFSNIIGKNTKVKLKLEAQNLLLNAGMMIVVCVRRGLSRVGGNRKLKKTTTMMVTRTSPNKRFKEQNNSCARAL